MSVEVLNKEFNENIKMYIPFHEVSSPPRIGDVEGQPFDCGCGETHTMNFDHTILLQMEASSKLFFYLQHVAI